MFKITIEEVTEESMLDGSSRKRRKLVLEAERDTIDESAVIEALFFLGGPSNPPTATEQLDSISELHGVPVQKTVHHTFSALATREEVCAELERVAAAVDVLNLAPSVFIGLAPFPTGPAAGRSK